MSLDKVLEEEVFRSIHLGQSRIKLPGCLVVEMLVENSVFLHLTLWRDNKPPSQVEWNTICKYFPWPITVKPNIVGNSMMATFGVHPKYFMQQPLFPLPH